MTGKDGTIYKHSYKKTKFEHIKCSWNNCTFWKWEWGKCGEASTKGIQKIFNEWIEIDSVSLRCKVLSLN